MQRRIQGYANLDDADIQHFKAVLGDEGNAVEANQEALEPYNRDWMGIYKGHSKLLLRPGTTEQVSAILRYAHKKHFAIVPQGGNTGLVGGSVPVHDEIILSLSRMNKILSFDPASGALVAQAGCILQNLDDHVAQYGFIMPLDLGAKGSCQIGGNISTNAGGLRLLRYGPLHGSVLGLEVVLADGQVLDLLRTLRKDNTGIHLKHLFIGSEGTLGVVTAVSIECAPRPSSVQVVFLGLESYAAVTQVLSKARKMLGEILSAFEFLDAECMRLSTRFGSVNPLGSAPTSGAGSSQSGQIYPFYVLVETHGSNGAHDREKLDAFLEAVMADGEACDGTLAENAHQASQIWKIREGISEALPRCGAVYKYDVSLPTPLMHRLVEEVKAQLTQWPGASVLGYGHVGDGNLHLNIVSPEAYPDLKAKIEPFVFEWVSNAKGSISAEHGLGQMKADAIYHTQSPLAVDVMRSIKRLLDPQQILNPYKMLPKG